MSCFPFRRADARQVQIIQKKASDEWTEKMAVHSPFPNDARFGFERDAIESI